jgi:hypothetical protein
MQVCWRGDLAVAYSNCWYVPPLLSSPPETLHFLIETSLGESENDKMHLNHWQDANGALRRTPCKQPMRAGAGYLGCFCTRHGQKPIGSASCSAARTMTNGSIGFR